VAALNQESVEKSASAFQAELARRRESRPENLTRFKEDPLGFIRWDFPWGRPGPLERFEGPDVWQVDFLTELGELIRKREFDGVNSVAPIRMTRTAGKGVGKSVMAAFLTSFLLKCWKLSKGTVTANTYVQLETKTWATISQWLRMSRSSSPFEIRDSGVYHRVERKAWSCTPQTSDEKNKEAFAGQHAATSVQYYIFDESSAIADTIFKEAERGLVDGMPMIFVFGNPTKSTGTFFRINFGDEKERWNHGIIDSRTCKIPNKQELEDTIRLAPGGEDDDDVRVYIRGLPPLSNPSMQVIDPQRVYDAQKRTPEVLDDEPLVAGVDLSRGGGDPAVVRFRRGNDARSIAPRKLSPQETRDSMQVVGYLSDLAKHSFGGRKVAAFFIDGGSMGGPIIDRLHQLGLNQFIEVQFGGGAPQPDRYANMRAWMWFQLAEALGSRLAIDKDPVLELDLTSVAPGRRDKKNRFVLESKESMKARGLASPNDGDALALTYARTVGPQRPERIPPKRNYNIKPEAGSWMGL